MKSMKSSISKKQILQYLNKTSSIMASDTPQPQTKKLNGYQDVQDGPVSQAKRQCRDMICCLLFLTMIVAMGYLAIHGFVNGNPAKVYRATDENGVTCGEPGGVAQKFPYAYFYNPTSGDLSNRRCVAVCPQYSGGTLSTLSCYNGVSCTYSVTILQDGSYSATPASTSVIIGYETSTVIDRVCIPSSTVFSGAFASYSDTFSTYLNQSDLASVITDIQNNWQWLLVGIGFCVLISFIYMYALKCIAGCVVWSFIFGIILLFAGLGVIFLFNAGKLSSISSEMGYMGIPSLSGSTQQAYAIYGYISFGFAGLFLLILLCCFSRIRLAVAVCKAAGQFVSGVCLVIFVPIIQALLTLIMWAACLIAMLYLVASANFIYDGSVFTSIASYEDSNLMRFYFFLFGTLWCNAFIQAMGIFVIASACCIWYYNHGPNSELNFPILRSYKMIYRYHFGSLAFGSFILAVVNFLQLMVEAFKKQAESTGADQNVCFEYVVNCVRCCLACVQRIVEFINKTAYIQIALRGKSFCSAAKDGFDIVWSNGMRVAIVAGVGAVMMFLGKIMITVGSVFAFYCLITYVATIKENILEPIYLLIIIGIIAFAIGTLFMSVYSIAMDTILQCFIVDQENQKVKGGQKTAKYAPPEIRELIDDAE